MSLLRVARAAAAATLFGVAAGCGGGLSYVKVSGVVTVDGQPYPNAVVAFQPVGTADNPNPGRGSSALTDASGRFSLVTDDGTTGAVIGTHRVRIQTKRDDPEAFFDPEAGSADNVPAPKKGGKVDPIPTEWYSDKSSKTFVVPAGGTDKANFDIESRKAAKKK